MFYNFHLNYNPVLVEMQDMLENTSDSVARQKQRILLQQKHKEELKHTDMKLVLQLDQKVRSLSLTLQMCNDYKGIVLFENLILRYIVM